jgi:hypothetical protein
VVTRSAPGVVSLVAELRGHERALGRRATPGLRGGRQWMALLNRLRTMVGLPKYSPPMPRLPDGRPRLDGAIGWSRIRAAPEGELAFISNETRSRPAAAPKPALLLCDDLDQPHSIDSRPVPDFREPVQAC